VIGQGGDTHLGLMYAVVGMGIGISPIIAAIFPVPLWVRR